MKVSVLLPACNQGKHVKPTCQSARKALGDGCEIIVLDDQSTDGCCDDLPEYVRVIRPDDKLGCPTARIRLEKEATGDVLLWADPHCRFDSKLLALAQIAHSVDAIIQPAIDTVPAAGRRYGAKWIRNVRGVNRERLFRKPKEPGLHRIQALYGGVYLCRRQLWNTRLGWLPLPGVTSSQDNGLSLLAWFANVDMFCNHDFVCKHWKSEEYSGLGKGDHAYPWDVSARVYNNVAVHWAFFEKSWGYWSEKLERWLRRTDGDWNLDDVLKMECMEQVRRHVRARKVRSEDEFLITQLGLKPGDYDGRPHNNRVECVSR